MFAAGDVHVCVGFVLCMCVCVGGLRPFMMLYYTGLYVDSLGELHRYVKPPVLRLVWGFSFGG